jgi:hypothetical protein
MLIDAVSNIEKLLEYKINEKEKEMNEFAMVPVKDVNDIATIGKWFAESGMFGCTNEGQGMVLAMTCMSEKISPLKFKQTYHLIDGSPSMRADAMLAKFAERGGRFKVIEKSPKRAAIQLVTKDNDQTFSMTIEEAMAEPFPWTKDKQGNKILKKNWSTPFMQMCMIWSRVISNGVRTLDPGVNMGVYTPEEVQDFSNNEVIDITTQTIKPMKGEKKAAPAAVVPPSVTEPKKPEEKVVTGEVIDDKTDYSIIPIGAHKGKQFDVLNDKALQVCLGTDKVEMLPGHKAYVKKVVAKRAEEAAKNAKKEPETTPFPTGGSHE